MDLSKKELGDLEILAKCLGPHFIRNLLNYSCAIIAEEIKKYDSLVLEVLQYFECKRCGKCCRKAFVQVSDEEIASLCKHLHIGFEEFDSEYMDQEAIENYLRRPCPFLKGNDCSIYEQRPNVCRVFPFTETGISQTCPMGAKIAAEIERRFPRERLLEEIPIEKRKEIEEDFQRWANLTNQLINTNLPNEYLPEELGKKEERFFVNTRLLKDFLDQLKVEHSGLTKSGQP